MRVSQIDDRDRVVRGLPDPERRDITIAARRPPPDHADARATAQLTVTLRRHPLRARRPMPQLRAALRRWREVISLRSGSRLLHGWDRAT
jgi:hypothetical protein